MVRLPDWQSRLSDYLTASANQPFRYGSLDCGLFVADAIRAMTGADVAELLRGRYRNRPEAFRAIKELCGKPSMEAVGVFLADRYGLPDVPILRAQRGDAVCMGSGRDSKLGSIAMHGTEILTPYRGGILRIPLTSAQRTWRV